MRSKNFELRNRYVSDLTSGIVIAPVCSKLPSRISGGHMEPVKKILAPTDLSDLSSAGLRYALEMGRSRSAEVIVYHVIDLGDHRIKREDSGPVREMLERHRRMLDKFLWEKFAEEMNLTEVRQVVEFGGA